MKNNYINEIYNAGFYNTMSPLNFKTQCILNGYVPPKIKTACELGFGFGNSINIFASTTDIEWYGTDFNQNHAIFARKIAENSGNGAKLFADSFERFLERDLPQFDYITLHGIYSWVDESVREQILNFIDKKLATGGGLYISYNINPGQTQLQPLRCFLKNYQKYEALPTTSLSEITHNAFCQLERLGELGADFVNKNERLKEFINKHKNDSRYPVHEFLNSAWELFNILDIAADLDPMQLSYVGWSDVNPAIKTLFFNQDQLAFLDEVSNPLLKEFYIDHLSNRSFRSDFWVRGGTKMIGSEHYEYLLDQSIILIRPFHQLDYRATLLETEVNLDKSIYESIFNYLKDGKPKKIRDLVNNGFIESESVFFIISTLITVDYVCFYEEPNAVVVEKTTRMNDFLLNQSTDSKLEFLVSPVTQKGIVVNNLDKLFLRFIRAGEIKPEGLAQKVKNWLDQNQKSIVLQQNNGVEITNEDIEQYIMKLAEQELQQCDMLKQRGLNI